LEYYTEKLYFGDLFVQFLLLKSIFLKTAIILTLSLIGLTLRAQMLPSTVMGPDGTRFSGSKYFDIKIYPYYETLFCTSSSCSNRSISLLTSAACSSLTGIVVDGIHSSSALIE